MSKRDCPLCGEPLEDDASLHDVVKCEKTELLKGRNEIKKLKQSVNDWKDAWFQARDIIGFLWWHHPALDNNEKLVYYQTNLQRLRAMHNPNDVYIGGRLVGSGTSPDAKAAIQRLMEYRGKETTDSGCPVSSGDQVRNTQSHDGNDSPGRSGQGESGTSQTPAGV